MPIDENFLAVVQEDLHLIECLSVALDFPKVFVNPDHETLLGGGLG